ncbi:unnamed protein product, partial [Sphacelaria rigidula]
RLRKPWTTFYFPCPADTGCPAHRGLRSATRGHLRGCGGNCRHPQRQKGPVLSSAGWIEGTPPAITALLLRTPNRPTPARATEAQVTSTQATAAASKKLRRTPSKIQTL